MLVCVLVAGFAWFRYYPASPMITAIGLPGPGADVDRTCGPNYRKIALVGFVPTRELVCHGSWRARTSFREGQDVTLDTFTRRIRHARRSWSQPDSNSWQRSADSVTAAMQRLGGEAISCWQQPPGLNRNIRATKHWRFSSYFVRLVAYRFEDQFDGGPWLLQLDGYREPPMECVIDPWRFNR